MHFMLNTAISMNYKMFKEEQNMKNSENEIVAKTVKLQADDISEIDELCKSNRISKAQLVHDMLYAYKKDNLITTNPDLSSELQRYNEYHKCQFNILVGLIQYVDNQDEMIKNKYNTKLLNDSLTISQLRNELTNLKDEFEKKEQLIAEKEGVIKEMEKNIKICQQNNDVLKECNNLLNETISTNETFKEKFEKIQNEIEDMKKEKIALIEKNHQMTSKIHTLENDRSVLEMKLSEHSNFQNEIAIAKDNELTSMRKENEFLKNEIQRLRQELDTKTNGVNRIVVPCKRLR